MSGHVQSLAVHERRPIRVTGQSTARLRVSRREVKKNAWGKLPTLYVMMPLQINVANLLVLVVEISTSTHQRLAHWNCW